MAYNNNQTQRKTKMKTTILFLVLFTFTLSLTAQEIKVPVKVKDAFTKLYPKATGLTWGKEGKDEFEAEFKDQGKSISVVMNAEGKLIETETVIPKTDLPKGVAEYVAKKYEGYSITDAAKIVDAKNNITFEAEISKGKVKKDVMFTKDGKPVVKKESKSEKEEKGEKEEDEEKD